MDWWARVDLARKAWQTQSEVDATRQSWLVQRTWKKRQREDGLASGEENFIAVWKRQKQDCGRSQSRGSWSQTQARSVLRGKCGVALILRLTRIVQQQWIQHMSLAEDGYSDPPGIRVRPLKGRDGVSFLLDDSIPSFIRKATYVMGPTMSNLAAIGYTDDNLVAFPYDWRLPLPHLETRDKVFTELRATIERMVKKNNSKIIILAHSMGNRTIHYFLNMVAAEEGGRQWIDDHIHSLFAVAAPWLGAPKMARGMISGERMGLDMFLRSRQAVEIVKTHGAFPSLLPIGLRHWFDDRTKRFMYFDMGTPITEEEYEDESDSDSETEEKEMSFKKNFILNLFKRVKTPHPVENNEQNSKVSFVNVTEFNDDDNKKSSRKRRVKRSNSAKDSNENSVKKRRRGSAGGYDSEKEIKSPITSDNEINPLSSPDNSAPSSPRRSRRKISRSGSYGEKHNALSDNDDGDEIVPQNSERKSSRAKRSARKSSTSTSGSYALPSNTNSTNNNNNNTNVTDQSDSSGNASEQPESARIRTLQFKTELKKTRTTSDASKRPLALSNSNVNVPSVSEEEVAENDDKHFHHTEEPILIINKPGTNKPISQYQGVSIKKALLTAGFEVSSIVVTDRVLNSNCHKQRQYNHLEERRKDKYFGGHGEVPSAILEPPPVNKIFAVYGKGI